MKQLLSLCTVLLTLSLPFTAWAELPKQIKEDFSTLSGYVVMPAGAEYLIDLDASHGLREGDILSIVTPGAKIIHPVTHEVLGSLDSAKAFLRVTRLKSGYSYAEVVSGDYAPVKGDQVRRFELVPARISGLAAESELAADIKAELPHLDWVAAGNSEQKLLDFVITGSVLTVKDASGKNLRTYPGIVSNESDIAQPLKVIAPTPVENSPSPGLEPTALSGIVHREQPAVDVWMGPNLSNNPIGLVVGDFDQDGRQETAIAMENYLLIVEITQGKQKQEDKIEFPSGTKLLSIDSIDLDGNGVLEMYLSASSGTELSSQVVEYVGDSYQRSKWNLPWFMSVADIPGQGEVLLGQTLGSQEDPYGEARFLVNRYENELSKGDVASIPQRVNLFSFVSINSDGPEQLFAYVTVGDYLKIVDSAGDQLWESDTHFGGTEVNFYSSNNINRELVEPVYIPQRTIKTKSDEILVTQNDGLRAMQRYHDFDKSRVVALRWNGFAMEEMWRTTDQNGYLADFALADADNDGDDEIVMVVKYQHENLFRKGRSAVVIYELAN